MSRHLSPLSVAPRDPFSPRDKTATDLSRLLKRSQETSLERPEMSWSARHEMGLAGSVSPNFFYQALIREPSRSLIICLRNQNRKPRNPNLRKQRKLIPSHRDLEP